MTFVDFDIIAKIVLRDLDMPFRFQIFNIREICLLSYITGKLKLFSKIGNIHFAIEQHKPVLFRRGLDTCTATAVELLLFVVGVLGGGKGFEMNVSKLGLWMLPATRIATS